MGFTASLGPGSGFSVGCRHVGRNAVPLSQTNVESQRGPVQTSVIQEGAVTWLSSWVDKPQTQTPKPQSRFNLILINRFTLMW